MKELITDKLKSMGRKGQALGLNSLAGAVVLFGGIAITLGVMASVLAQVQSTQAAQAAGCLSATGENCSYAFNASSQGLEGLNQVTQFEATIGLVIAASVIIALVFGALVVSRR